MPVERSQRKSIRAQPNAVASVVGAALCLLGTLAAIVTSLVMYLPPLFSYLASR